LEDRHSTTLDLQEQKRSKRRQPFCRTKRQYELNLNVERPMYNQIFIHTEISVSEYRNEVLHASQRLIIFGGVDTPYLLIR
jgi:hypothetical protein